MEIATVSDYRTAVRQGAYAWPGGYPRFWICDDGGCMCWRCAARLERRAVLEAIRDRDRNGFQVVAVDINWEDPVLTCEHCGGRIESAYAEDDASSKPVPTT